LNSRSVSGQANLRIICDNYNARRYGGKAHFKKAKPFTLHIRGDEQEQRGAKRLVEEKRPGLAAVIAAVQKIKGEKWNAFRDRHGDRGREMVLYLGRRVCGMKLAELAAAVWLRNYAVVATCVKRYEQCLQTNATEQASMKRLARLLNCEM